MQSVNTASNPCRLPVGQILAQVTAGPWRGVAGTKYSSDAPAYKCGPKQPAEDSLRMISQDDGMPKRASNTSGATFEPARGTSPARALPYLLRRVFSKLCSPTHIQASLFDAMCIDLEMIDIAYLVGLMGHVSLTRKALPPG
jgi:hypothetical protein